MKSNQMLNLLLLVFLEALRKVYKRVAEFVENESWMTQQGVKSLWHKINLAKCIQLEGGIELPGEELNCLMHELGVVEAAMTKLVDIERNNDGLDISNPQKFPRHLDISKIISNPQKYTGGSGRGGKKNPDKDAAPENSGQREGNGCCCDFTDFC